MDLSFNIGKVTKDELADLDAWDLKFLYKLFYKEIYGLYLSFPDELMSEAFNEFSWPICVPGIMLNEILFNSGKFDMSRWKYADKPLDVTMLVGSWSGRLDTQLYCESASKLGC